MASRRTITPLLFLYGHNSNTITINYTCPYPILCTTLPIPTVRNRLTHNFLRGLDEKTKRTFILCPSPGMDLARPVLGWSYAFEE